jgi:hypothetical protein
MIHHSFEGNTLKKAEPILTLPVIGHFQGLGDDFALSPSSPLRMDLLEGRLLL